MNMDLEKILPGCFIIFFLSVPDARAQDLDALNQFKYAVVQTLYYENMEPDKYAISSNVRKHFIEKGFTTVTETKRYWPEELYNNPCMAVYCYISAQSGVFSKYKVLIEMKDCNGKVLYRRLGKGTGETSADAFKEATEMALSKFDKFDYKYEPGEVVVKEAGPSSKGIEGLYKATGQDKGLNIELTMENEAFKAIVTQSNSDKYRKGQVLAVFRASSLGENLYNVTWLPEDKKHYETYASYDKEAASLTVELKDEKGRRKLVFRKTNQ